MRLACLDRGSLTAQWLLVPEQSTPPSPVEWQAIRLTGSEVLAVRASRKLKNDELLITSFAATRLRMELDRVPLWRGDHVSVKQLAQDFAKYPYLPRLVEPSVLIEAERQGVALLTWEREGFGYADSLDEAAGRYRGLRAGQQVAIGGPEPVPPPAPKPRRFYGTVELTNPMRLGSDAGKIAEEVIAHLAALPGAKVRVTLEIEATLPEGVPDHVVRVVTENGRTLRFSSQGVEVE